MNKLTGILGNLIVVLILVIMLGSCTATFILDKDIKIVDDVAYSSEVYGAFPEFEVEKVGDDNKILSNLNIVYYREIHTDILYLLKLGDGRYNSGTVCKLVDPKTGEPITYAKYLEYYEIYKEAHTDEYEADEKIPEFSFQEVKRSRYGSKTVGKDEITGVYYLYAGTNGTEAGSWFIEPILDPETNLPITDDRYMKLYGKE